MTNKKEITDQILKAREEMLALSGLLQYEYYDKSLEAIGASEILTNWIEGITKGE